MNFFRPFFTSIVVALGVFAVASHVSAATIYSNSVSGDDTTGNGSAGTPYRTFFKAYTSASSGDTIDLTGTFTWTDAGESGDATTTGYTLSKNLTIRGQGVDQTFVQASSTQNTADRSVFYVSSGYTVTLQDLTIRYGVVNTGNRGGGVSNAGTLTMLRTRVTRNRYNSTSYYGAGGVFVDTNASITVATSTFDNNTFTGRYYGAGGLWALQNTPVTIENSTFHSNSSTSDQPNTFTYSYADPAGAFGTFRFGALKITNSTFTGNFTNSYGGAMQIYYKDSVKITNCTVTNNTATYGAGGILYQSEWNGYTLYLKNTILADNIGNGASSDFYAYDASSGGRVQSNGYNIVEASTNYTFNATGDLAGNQASLNISSSLADNSSSWGVQTLALSSGSVAINAGDPSNAANSGVAIPSRDARNATRSGTADIGAYEYNGGIGTSYTFTYTAGTGGTISGSTPQTVNANANGSAVTAVPNTGYHFVDWSDASTTNPRTDTNASAHVTVTANFALNTYSVTYTAGTGGTVTGTVSQTVNYGANGSAVTAVPNTGYHFVDWSDASTTNPRTDTSVTSSLSVTAQFALNTYTLTYLAGAHGGLTGSSTQLMAYGSSGSAVTAVPAAGYTFIGWSDASTTNPRTDTSVTSSLSVTAQFADLTAPSLSSISASPGTDNVTITWTSNEEASSRVDYGVTASYGTQTSEADTSPRVTAHSVAISGLPVCTVFHYRVQSSDAAANTATSTDATFQTTGCSSPTTSSPSGGGGGGATFVAPGGVGEGAENVTIGMGELKDLGTLKQGGVNALAYVRAKLAFTAVGSKTLGLRTGTAEVTDLDLVKNVVRVLVTPGSPANLTLSLGEAKTVDLDQDGIQDVRFTFASLWVNRVELTVKSIPLDPLALNPPKPGTATVAATPTPVALSDAATVCGYRFTRDLKLGMKGEDVRALQKCFTKLGISLVASKQSFNGKETDYFGMATKTALASFQRTYHLPALGYLGSMTRTLLNAPLSKSYYASKPQ